MTLACVSTPWAQEQARERAAREAYRAALAEALEAAKGRAWLGVFLSDAVDGGIDLVAVVPGGPAERAGLREADLILEVDGKPTPNQAILEELIQGQAPGDSIEIGFLRSGESLALQVELGERTGRFAPLADRFPVPTIPMPRSDIPRPNRIQSRAPRTYYGLQLAEMTPALREHFGAPPDAGVLVLGVAPVERATPLGLRVGDVVVQLGGRGIRDEDQFRWTLSSWPADRPLEARVIRGGESLIVGLPAVAMPTAPQAAPAPAPGPELSRELRANRLRAEIERLEDRIRALREELEELRKQR